MVTKHHNNNGNAHINTSGKKAAQTNGATKDRDKITRVTRVAVHTYEKAMKELEKH